MKPQTLQLFFTILSSCFALMFAQSSFKDKNLQFVEEIASVSQNDIKSYMKKKGFSLEDSDNKFNSKLFAFTNSSDQNAVIGYTDAGKLYSVYLSVKENISAAESELKSQQFKEEDDLFKKSSYKYSFSTYKSTDGNSLTLFTDEINTVKPSKNDRLVTVDRLKEVLGQNNKSVQKILVQKKYFHDESLDDEEDGRSEEVFIDIDYETEIVVTYKSGKSFIVETDNITEEDYNNVLQWLKSNRNEKMETERAFLKSRDSWDILNGGYTVFLSYENEPNFKPSKITLRKND